MHRDLDIRPLRTLATIVDTGGFRRAAEDLNISQPAVSQHIRRLDALVGEPAFREAGQTLALSAVGEELLRHARQLVRANDELILRLSAPLRPRRIALGVCNGLVGLTPTLLRRLTEQGLPGPTVRTGPAAELTEQLAKGEIDMLLKVGRPHSTTDQVVGAISCEWFGQQVLVSRDSLPVALFGAKATPMRQLAIDTLNSVALPWHTVYEGSSAADAAAVSRSGLGVSLLFTGYRNIHLSALPSGALPGPLRSLTVILMMGPHVTDDAVQATLTAAKKEIEPKTPRRRRARPPSHRATGTMVGASVAGPPEFPGEPRVTALVGGRRAGCAERDSTASVLVPTLG